MSKYKTHVSDIIGTYTLDGITNDYTKENLRGDIAILTMDMVQNIIKYMNENGYQDVYITPLITEITNKGVVFSKIL